MLQDLTRTSRNQTGDFGTRRRKECNAKAQRRKEKQVKELGVLRALAIKILAHCGDGSELVGTSGRPAKVAGYYSQVGLRRPSKPPQGGFASSQHAVSTAVQQGRIFARMKSVNLFSGKIEPFPIVQGFHL